MRARSLLFLLAAVAAALAALVWARILPVPGFLGGEPAARLAEGTAPEAADVTEEDEVPDLAARPREARAVPRLPGEDAAAPAPTVAAGAVALEGVVLRADGRPALGAEVRLVGPGGVVAQGATDADGRFRLEVARGVYDLVVRSGFDGAVWLRSVLVDGRPLAAPLELSAAADVRVEVLADGRPASGADVRARLLAEGGGEIVVAEGATGSDGAFLAPAVPLGRYVLEASTTEGYVLTRRVEVKEDRTFTFSVPAAVRLSGRVTDAETRLPLPANVLVTVGLGDATFLEAAGASGADGVYSMAVPRGRAVRFSVENPDYAPFPAANEAAAVLRSLRGLADQPSVLRDASLRRGALVRGTVTMVESKEPVASLSLRFTQNRNPVARTAQTAADGTYEARGLGPGTWRASIETAGWYPNRGTDTVTLAPPSPDGKPSEGVLDLVVWSAGRVSGVVVTAADAPVPGARVWLAGGGGTVRGARQAGRPLETTTGADGSFAIDDVPPDASVRVRAALGDAEAAPSAAFRLADGPPPPLRLVLGPTARLRGRVTDLRTGEAVAGGRVAVEPVGEPAGRGRRDVAADAQGRYEVAGLLPGAWLVRPSLRRDYLPAEPREVRVTGEVRDLLLDLQLDPGLAVGGVVVDEAGRAVAGARAFLQGTEDGGTSSPSVGRGAVTDAAGAFRWTGLRSGRYVLTVRRSGYPDVRLDLRGGEDRLRVVLVAPPPTGN